MKRNPPLHGSGSSAATLAEWVALAKPHVMDLVESHLAVAHSELEAALSEYGVPQTGPTGIPGKRLHLDPHVLTEATRELRDLTVIKQIDHITKGDRRVALLCPADLTGRTTITAKAVRRKGMLVARLNALSAEMGEAGELVVRHSLTTAGDHLSAATTGFGQAARFLGLQLPGPLDSAAWVQATDPSTELRSLYAVPIEVKNRQQTIYPIHKEIHQLLHKAALLQARHPTQPIVPVLVCRRAHVRLFWMAADLGFLVHSVAEGRQWITPTKGAGPRLINEIRDELGLRYLTILDPAGQTPRIRQFFEQTLPTRAAASAARWATTASTVLPYAELLRNETVSSAQRQDLVRELRQELEPVLVTAGYTDDLRSWSLPDLEYIET